MKKKEKKQVIDDVEALLFDENKSIRYHAAEFVYLRMMKNLKDGTKKRGRKSKKRKKGKATLGLQNMVEFMREHDHISNIAEVVVDNFWERTSIFKEWEDMTGLLNQKDFSEDDILNILKMITASVKKLCGSLTTPSSVFDTVKIKKKRIREEKMRDAMDKMTRHLCGMIPQLLAKYQGDGEKVEVVLEIAQYLPLQDYERHQLGHVCLILTYFFLEF